MRPQDCIVSCKDADATVPPRRKTKLKAMRQSPGATFGAGATVLHGYYMLCIRSIQPYGSPHFDRHITVPWLAMILWNASCCLSGAGLPPWRSGRLARSNDLSRETGPSSILRYSNHWQKIWGCLRVQALPWNRLIFGVSQCRPEAKSTFMVTLQRGTSLCSPHRRG